MLYLFPPQCIPFPDSAVPWFADWPDWNHIWRGFYHPDHCPADHDDDHDDDDDDDDGDKDDDDNDDEEDDDDDEEDEDHH